MTNEERSQPRLLLVANVAKEHVLKFHIPTISMLKRNGWQVDVACKMDADIPACDSAFDLPIERSPFHLKTLRAVQELRSIIRENQYDIVYCHTVTGSLVARLAARPFRRHGLKVIYLAHGFYFYHGAPAKNWIAGYLMEKILARMTDVLITINAEDFQFAAKRLNIPKVYKIDGIGVDISRFSRKLSPEEKRVCRDNLGLDATDYVGIYVAELTKLKNQTSLIQAAKVIQKTIPNFKLLLVGPDHLAGTLDKEAQELPAGSVIFTGWRDDVGKLLCASDVALASSRSEGLGLNIIEAMACRIPVVAYENRGHSEIISDRVNGRLIPLNDYESMAKAVVELWESQEEADRLAQNAAESIQRFDRENVLQEIREILWEQLQNSGYDL